MSDETMVDGIPTSLPPEEVADLQPKAPEPAAEPVKPDAQPASPKTEEPAPATAEPPKTEPAKPAEPVRDEQGKFKPKPKPIATLLEKKHQLETELADRDKTIADLQAKIQQAASQPASTANTDKVKALAEKYGVDETLLAEIVAASREGMNPQLPAEVADLVAREQAAKLEQAELEGFENDYGSLVKGIPEDDIKDPKVKERLFELAYSDEKAPDGEEYFKKPLVELYFKFVKPEIEPPTPSAESSRGGSKSSGQVIDFAEIKADPVKLDEFVRTASPEEFDKYTKWERETTADTPMRKQTLV